MKILHFLTYSLEEVANGGHVGQGDDEKLFGGNLRNLHVIVVGKSTLLRKRRRRKKKENKRLVKEEERRKRR